MIDYNNYPKKVKPRILSPKEVVEYELINIRKDVMDNTGRRLAIPQIKGIPNSDVILVKDDDGEEVYINIAYIVAGERTDNPTFGNVHFLKQNGGVIRVTGGNYRDQKLFEFLELTNYNSDSPYRDVRVAPVFRRVDRKKRAEEKRNIRNLKKQAFKIAEGLSSSEVGRIYIGLGHKELTDEAIMRDKIEELADANPEKFIVSSQNPDFVIMEVAFQAEKKKMISVDYGKCQIKGQTGEVLYSWNQEEGEVNWMEKFVSFVKSDEGSAYYKELIESLKPRAKVK